MKKLMVLFLISFSFSVLSQEAGRLVSGAQAEEMFNQLENAQEYKYGAIVSGLRIETIVRHDQNTLSCSKESVQYGDEEPIITFSCTFK